MGDDDDDVEEPPDSDDEDEVPTDDDDPIEDDDDPVDDDADDDPVVDPEELTDVPVGRTIAYPVAETQFEFEEVGDLKVSVRGATYYEEPAWLQNGEPLAPDPPVVLVELGAQNATDETSVFGPQAVEAVHLVHDDGVEDVPFGTIRPRHLSPVVHAGIAPGEARTDPLQYPVPTDPEELTLTYGDPDDPVVSFDLDEEVSPPDPLMELPDVKAVGEQATSDSIDFRPTGESFLDEIDGVTSYDGFEFALVDVQVTNHRDHEVGLAFSKLLVMNGDGRSHPELGLTTEEIENRVPEVPPGETEEWTLIAEMEADTDEVVLARESFDGRAKHFWQLR